MTGCAAAELGQRGIGRIELGAVAMSLLEVIADDLVSFGNDS